MSDREAAIEALRNLWPNIVLLREEAELIIDAYEALPGQITHEMVARVWDAHWNWGPPVPRPRLL